MPVRFDINDGVIALHMIGTYETAQIETTLLEALGQPQSSEPIGLLFDVSESESLKTRRAEQVTAMGYFLASHSHRFGRRLALVGSGDFSFGMMRLGNVVLEQEGVTSEVFRNEHEGREWLHRRP